MSNLFNISVKPEIAALEAKVDIIDTEVDAVRATDIPGTNTKVDANNTIIADLHDTDLPGAVTKIDDNKTVIDDIHDTDLPDAVTKIDDNKTAIDAIQTDQLFSVDLSDAEISAADTDRFTTQTSYIKCKEIEVFIPGTYRITFEMASGGTAIDAYAKLYKNGVAYGTERINDTQGYVLYSEDLAFTFGDLIQLYHYTSNGAYAVHSRNFKVKGVKSVSISNVITD